MKNVIYLLCGVPGSGKSWVCEQLKDRFYYVKQDDFIYKEAKKYIETLVIAAKIGGEPVLTDCPFGERELKTKLEAHGLTVQPYFIIENPEIVKERYFKREGKSLPKASVTRATTIKDRALEWSAPYGSSNSILELLKKIK